MELNPGGRGEDGGFDLGILRVERRDALLDVGFEKPGDAQLAGVEAPLDAQPREARLDLLLHQRPELGRHAGQQDQDAALRLRSKGRARCRGDWEAASSLRGSWPGAN